MILPDKYVYYALEMRVKTRVIHGTLCFIDNPNLINNAMKYFDIWNDGKYISQPFTEITRVIASNMTFDLFRIFIELNDLYTPPFTNDEIRIIMDVSKKYGYKVTHQCGYISIRREFYGNNLRTRH